MASNESLKSGATEKPKKLPQLTPDQLVEIQSQLPIVRHDITRLLGHFDDLRTNHSAEFARVNKRHPNLAKSMESINALLYNLSEDNKSLSNEEVVQGLNEYNLYAHEINSVLRKIESEDQEEREKAIVSAVNGTMPFNEAEFSEEEKQELRAFAQDLWKELFPESGVDKFTKWSTGQKDLEGYQKILLAPANGIESAVVGFIDLFKPKTYKELYGSIEAMSGLNYKDWCELWNGAKFTYEQLPTTEKVAPVLSLICALAFLTGGAGKITQMASEMGYSTKTVGAIRGVFSARTLAHVMAPAEKVIPLGAMLGISLPYVKLGES